MTPLYIYIPFSLSCYLHLPDLTAMDHHGHSSIMVGPTCRLVYQSYKFTDMSLLELHDVGLLNYSTHLDSRHQILLTLLETILTKVQHSRAGSLYRLIPFQTIYLTS